MKISFGMIVINGEPFIKYNLLNLYPHAHEILIVEGAVEKFKHAATPNGHSLDDTVKIIKEFPDPENKIKLIQNNGFWPEKDEMSNAYMACCTGDYIWQVDVDEFYKSEDIEKVRKYLVENPDVTRIDVQTINFWHGFKAVMQGATYCFGADRFRRIFKFKQGYSFLTHRPPTVLDGDGNICCDARVVTGEELVERLNVYMYHYSYVFKEGVRSKANYYANMGFGGGHEDGKKWAESTWLRFENPLRIHLIDFPPSWIVPFKGEHPVCIKQMVQEIGFKENPDVETFLNIEWDKFAQIGEYVCELCNKVNNSQINKYYASLLLFKKFMLPADFRTLNANISILMSIVKIISI